MEDFTRNVQALLAEILAGNTISVIIGYQTRTFSAAVARLLQLDDQLMAYASSPRIRKFLQSDEAAGLAVNACLDIFPMFHGAVKSKSNIDYNSIASYVALLDKIFAIYAPDQLQAVMRFLRPSEQGTVLEVGCFTGRLSLPLSAKVKRLAGLDSSGTAIGIAKRLARENGAGNCSFVEGIFPENAGGEYDYSVWFGPQKGTPLEFPSGKALVCPRPLPGKEKIWRTVPQEIRIGEKELEKYCAVPRGWKVRAYLDRTWPSLGELYQPLIILMQHTGL